MRRQRRLRCLLCSLLLGLSALAWLLLGTPLPFAVAGRAAQTCTFSLTSAASNFQAGGGSGGVAVTASQASCTWTATSNAPWLSITAGAAGTGNGLAGFTVAANPGAAVRTGTLTLAGQTFTVNEDGGLAGLQFYPLPAPVRLLDTRQGTSPNACSQPNMPIAGNMVRTQAARNFCGLPASAQAITGNVTTVQSGGGFLTLYPSGAAQPTVASTNFTANEIVNNVFTVGLGVADGAFNIYALTTTEVVVDVTGYYAPPATAGLYFHPLPAPVRLLETRAGQTVGCVRPGAPLPGNVDTLQTATGACTGIPAAARAIAGNATTVSPQSGGYLTLFPADASRPLVASSNYEFNQIVNGPFTVGLSPAGQFKIFTTATTELVIDVLGYFSNEAVDANGAGLLFAPLAHPVRLLETRNNAAFPGCFKPNAPLNGNQVYTQTARGLCDGLTIPANALGVVGNATVVLPVGGGFLTVWPSSATQPTIATSNYNAGQVVNRHFITGLGNADGAFKLFSQAMTDLVIDLSGYFTPLPANQPPLANAGADQMIAPNATAFLPGQVTDDGLPLSGSLTAAWSKLSGPGTVTFGNANQAATTATFSAAGVYVLRLTANDSALLATDDVTITVNATLAVNAGADQVITLPNTALLLGQVTGGAGAVTINWTKQSGPGSVLFSNASAAVSNALFALNGVYVLRLSATDSLTTVTDDIQITINADPTPTPPDPMTVAPPVDMTIATTVCTATEFLYTGANPIQTGVALGTINKARCAVLQGRALDKNNQPLPLVKITVLGHAEYGQTLSRADGRFDLVVNGGGPLTLQYDKTGFLTAQRYKDLPWQQYCAVPDVALMSYDANVTFIDLNSAAPIQVAQSTVNTDTSGTRRTTFFFKQGTTATMKLPGGAMQGLDKLHVRASEFTVGANGPNAMPGDLPATSAYTYAAEYSLDEAVAANATDVSFNQPVVQYNENFLNLPVGTSVPSGAYDKQQGIWLPSANGRIVKILSVSGGQANLDITGGGTPASDAELTALGVNAAERQQLAALYSVGQSLWRVPVNHFSGWDSNFGYGAPNPSGQPNGGSASGGSNGPNDPDCKPGCILGMQDQRLSEEIDVVGTRFFLRYDSTRPRGRVSDYTARIPLSGATLLGPVKRIELTVSIAGQLQAFTFPAQINQITSFTWDGKDAYGRDVQGQQEVLIDIANVYDGVYQNVARFGYGGLGLPTTTNTRQEIFLHRRQRLLLGVYSAPPQTLGGWTLSEHHAYDPMGQKLYEGNGKQRNVQTVSNVIETFAGGLSGFLGDGGPVSGARFARPLGVAIGPDGSVYVADSGNGRIRKIAPNGIVTTVAGNGGGCNPANFPCGDGGPATNASLSPVYRVVVARDGSLYLSGERLIWRVTPDGIIRIVAGTITTGFSGDGGPARQAQLSQFNRAYPAADGSVYVSDFDNGSVNSRIRRIDPNGIITTIAGNGTAGFSGDGGPATQAQINQPGDIVAAPDGNVYFIDQANNRIRRIAPDGIITTIAGTGAGGNSGDGGPALQATFFFSPFNPGVTGSMALAPDGSLYVVSYSFAAGRVRRIGPDGIITGIAGNGQLGSQGDGGPALQSQAPLAAIGLAPDNSIYTVGGGIGIDDSESRIRRVSSPLPGFTTNQIAIPSEDGTQLFRFDAQGRHLNTVNTLTGATVYSFAYDSGGRLATVTDGDNNVTTIQRNGSGNPTGILSPYTQLTTFTLNANGYLATITNPASQQYQFSYNAGGQMTSETDPRNNQNQFTYDANGRLTRDDDPATGFQTLTRTGQDIDFTVTHNTALNRQTGFRVQTLGTLDRNRINTLPDGTQELLLERGNGLKTFTDPDGTITNEQIGGDPRWKLQAPLTTSIGIATPGGLNYAETFARAATLTTPGDPLSLATQNDTLTINGRAFTSAFTAANRTFVNTSPLNRQATATIDTQGRLTNFQLANFNPLAATYDTRGRLATTVFGTGGGARMSLFAYNPGGFLASFTDALNRVTGFTYDAAGRVTQQTTPDSRIIGLGYDAKGNLISLTPPGRPAHAFTYNAVDWVAMYTPPAVAGTGATQFAYNLDRQLTTITQPGGVTINYGYDAAGRLSTRTIAAGTYNFSYSATTGNLTGLTAPSGPTLAFAYDGFLPTGQTWSGVIAGSVSHTFNNFFLPASQSVNGANTVTFTYDNDNLLTGAGSLAITRNAMNGLMTGATLSSVTDTRNYNGFGELASFSASFNATPLYSFSFTRDKLGRVTQKVETIGGAPATYDYTYDLAGRLQEVKLNSVTISSYTYDSNDNRLTRTTSGGTVTGTYDNQDRVTAYGAATYAYTANGELSGKTVGAQTTTYSYDALGNLRNATLPDSTQVEYVIDGLNRRAGKRVNGTLAQGWLYQDQLEPVAELDGGNNIISRFVYGTRTNTPDYVVKGGVTYRILTDHLGSVRLVVDAATGAIAQRLDYDEFGVVTMDTNPGFQPFGFAGGLYDPQTKLTRFGARDYDAETGRWTTKDPILFAAGDANLYRYVFNDPVNFTDPSGLQQKTPCPTPTPPPAPKPEDDTKIKPFDWNEMLKAAGEVLKALTNGQAGNAVNAVATGGAATAVNAAAAGAKP